ncbi:N-acetylmuramoyl-L-alanine amidase (plasmid) [Clostridium estertheticum]|uniref:N-acetylmuramoyl-L-alanine amidase n=1 Tax=Clostridium estertheticum TaxID=238834 RepID=UPI001C7D2BE6|nr:N-acetylmuramoyl-L-alanine amidase [Clostridium estertheticum]MBX4259717.1 N-acetylmuramoyl-L-alanine amidase [Clostridium estertheticum]WLC73304.1 N-acetylmuramoyl-L-alanine amidase [Clostridium estertheticum]
MRISVDFGHGTGEDRGAEGYLNEEKVIREYGPLVIAGLEKLGYTVLNCTPTMAGLTLAQSLAYRVNASNNFKAIFHLCLHVNAFETDEAHGCEVEYISATGKRYADNISAQIAGLGFTNRGSVSRPNLYVLKYTNAVAILIEPFFCDTKTDCNKYSAAKLANAIVKGFTGKDIPGNVVVKPVVVTKPVVVIPKVNPNVRTYRVVTGSFADESNADARIAELKAKGFESFKVLI